MGAKERVLNSVFISVGVAIILVLVTALVAPFFIDWTVYRSTFEEYAEKALGHQVTVLGEADMRLLPSPTVTFTDVRVGGAEDPLLVVSRFQMRMELPPLLKGEFRILDMSLDRPHLTVSLDEQGRPDWLTAMKSGGAITDVQADHVAFENITITDGAVTVVDARSGKTHSLDNADLVIKARSLAGPFRIDGPVELAGERYSLSLATGRRQENGAIRVKGVVTPERYSMTAALDGTLDTLDGVPRFDGDFQLKGIDQTGEAPEVIWSAEGAFGADTSKLEVTKAEYHFGPEDRRSGFSGRMNMIYAGDRHFDLIAKAKQIDLDRIYGGGPQKPVDLPDAASQVISVLRNLPVPDIAGDISLDVSVVVAGGELLQDVKLDLETRPGGWHVSRLAGRLPGRSTFTTEGDLVVRNKFSYRGTVSVNSQQPGALAAWIGERGDGSSRIQPVALEGRVSLVERGAALENLRLELGDAVITGGVSFRSPRQARKEFGLSLVADVLDVDQVEELMGLIAPSVGGADLWGETNVSLMMRARQVRVRGVEGKDLTLQAAYADDALRIDRLYTGDLAGAEVDVSGRVDHLLSAPVGNMEGKLQATDLTGLLSLLRSAWPDAPVLARLEQAADYMVPASFEGTFHGKGVDDGSRFEVNLQGTAGGVEARLASSLEGRVDDWRSSQLGVDMWLQGPDGGQILRQLGLNILPVDDLGQGQVSLEAKGRAKDGLELHLAATAPAASLNGDGSFRWEDDADPKYSLSGTLFMEDLGPFALLAGRMMPVMAGDIPVDLGYTLTGEGSKISLPEFSGKVGDVTLSGTVTGDLEPAQGESLRRFKGTMDLSELDLEVLSEMVLGPDQWASVGDGKSVWPSAAFGKPLLSSVDLSLDVTASQMVVGLGNPAENVSASLRLGRDELLLDHIAATYADGRMSGQLALRRSGAEGALSGRLKLEGLDLKQLVWTTDGQAVATGTVDLLADFEGAGRSISAIVAGMNGGGTLKITDGVLRGVNPQAFSLVMRAVDAGLDLDDAKIRDVFLSHMQAGSLRFDTLEAALGILGGRVSARNIAVDSQAADLFGSAQINLNDLSLDSDFSLTVDAGDEAVVGGEPQVGLLFTGPVEAPERKVNVAPFTAYLTLRAFEREVERVEKLQSEILEKQRLGRELKRLDQERLRRKREAAEAAAAEAARQLQDLANPDPLEEDRSSVDQPNIEGPIAPEPATSAAGGNASADPIAAKPDAADFAARIRQLLGAETKGPETDSAGETAGPGKLKPLAPPQTVEDLLAREIGLPASVLDGTSGFDTGAPRQ